MTRLVVPVLAASLLAPASAFACGGFFCDAVVDPVVQTAERVLFRVNGDGTVTTVVEIQFEGEPVDFGWVLPVPEGIDTDLVETAPAGLFDELEAISAPRFFAASPAMADEAAGIATLGSGCGPMYPPWMRARGVSDGMEFVPPEPVGVEVVGEAVVGPYAIEVITAEDGANLQLWLQQNGYQIPASAIEPMGHYVTSGMSFLGLKMSPDVPAGPIDALSFTYAADAPMLPLILTSVAAVDDMDITAYVLADQRYAPTNYEDVRFDHSVVSWTDEGTDYEEILPMAMDAAGGRGFTTEYASSSFASQAGEASAELLASGTYLTRFRTVISPGEMTVDPVWQPAPELGDVSNVHEIAADEFATAGGSLLLLVLGVVALRRKG